MSYLNIIVFNFFILNSFLKTTIYSFRLFFINKFIKKKNAYFILVSEIFFIYKSKKKIGYNRKQNRKNKTIT